jgi:hypothetical protein
MSKFYVLDDDSHDVTGGESFDTQTDAETWIAEFLHPSEMDEVYISTEPPARKNYASDLDDAESLARAMVDDVATSLEHFVQNIDQHLYQISAFDYGNRACGGLRIAQTKALILLRHLEEMREYLGVSK